MGLDLSGGQHGRKQWGEGSQIWDTSFQVVDQRAPTESKTQSTVVFGYLPELDGKALLRKKPYILTTGHGETNSEASQLLT